MLYNTMNPVTLSKYVINYIGGKFDPNVSHLKLQKLLYYIDSWHLATFDQPLFNQNFEAWVHGPVIRDVWDYFKDRAVLNGNLPKEEVDYSLDDLLSGEQVELINDVLDEYGKHNAYHLECLTHEEQPWIEARRGYSASDRCEVPISKTTMRNYYREMVYG